MGLQRGGVKAGLVMKEFRGKDVVSEVEL